MDKPTSDLQQEILALQCPPIGSALSESDSSHAYAAGFRAGYEEARREIAALVGEMLSEDNSIPIDSEQARRLLASLDAKT